MDTDGMYKDVHIINIGSDDENSSKKSKNSKAKAAADVEEFFLVYHRLNGSKGEKKGKRECKTCLCVSIFLFTSGTLIGEIVLDVVVLNKRPW